MFFFILAYLHIQHVRKSSQVFMYIMKLMKLKCAVIVTFSILLIRFCGMQVSIYNILPERASVIYRNVDKLSNAPINSEENNQAIVGNK